MDRSANLVPVPGTVKPRPVNEQELVKVLLEKFGVEPDMTRAYLSLVMEGDLAPEDLAKRRKTSVPEAHDVLDRMVLHGLAIRSSGTPQRYAALHPRMTMTNIFKVYENNLVITLRDRRATLDRVVNLLTPAFEDREANMKRKDSTDQATRES